MVWSTRIGVLEDGFMTFVMRFGGVEKAKVRVEECKCRLLMVLRGEDQIVYNKHVLSYVLEWRGVAGVQWLHSWGIWWA